MDYNDLVGRVVELIPKTVVTLPEDVIKALKQACRLEEGIAKNQLEKKKDKILFYPNVITMYHCSPLMEKKDGMWFVVSTVPSTSSRMELFEHKFIKKFGINLIIGKGDMIKNTQKALQKYIYLYASYTGGAGALAADNIKKVKDVFYLDELGMAEAVWIFEVKDFGPLFVVMDCHGGSIYKDSTRFDYMR
jgi:fumarate hydratase subunit beta